MTRLDSVFFPSGRHHDLWRLLPIMSRHAADTSAPAWRQWPLTVRCSLGSTLNQFLPIFLIPPFIIVCFITLLYQTFDFPGISALTTHPFECSPNAGGSGRITLWVGKVEHLWEMLSETPSVLGRYDIKPVISLLQLCLQWRHTEHGRHADYACH